MRFISNLILILLGLLANGASAQTLVEILDKNLEARGGLGSWREINTLQIIGTMALPDDSVVPISLEMKRPDRLRMEFQLQGQTGVRTFDGQKGWTWMPFDQDLEPRAMAEEELEQLRETADFDGPLIDWREKGYSLQYRGMSDAGGGRKGHLLELTRANGDRLLLFLDPETFLEFRQVSHLDRSGENTIVRTDLSDYRAVGAVVMPYVLDVTVVNSPIRQVLTIESIELNLDLPDDRFSFSGY